MCNQHGSRDKRFANGRVVRTSRRLSEFEHLQVRLVIPGKTRFLVSPVPPESCSSDHNDFVSVIITFAQVS